MRCLMSSKTTDSICASSSSGATFTSSGFSLLWRFFFFNDTATTDIYTLSLHDALPIWRGGTCSPSDRTPARSRWCTRPGPRCPCPPARSEEHTSELQSLTNLVCRLLLEKKKKIHRSTSQYKNDNKKRNQ